MTAAHLPIETVVRPRLPVDLRLTLGPLRRGPRDPTMLVDKAGAWWRATRTPQGPATARYSAEGDGIRVAAWGPGGGWCLEAAAELLGSRDSLDGFSPTGLVGELHRHFPGLRIPRSQAVFEALLPSILEQKVTGREAHDAFAAIVRAWGEPAPGPARLRLQPSPDALAATPYWAFHPLGVERKRTSAIQLAASRARRVEETVAMPAPDAHRRLQALPPGQLRPHRRAPRHRRAHAGAAGPLARPSRPGPAPPQPLRPLPRPPRPPHGGPCLHQDLSPCARSSSPTDLALRLVTGRPTTAADPYGAQHDRRHAAERLGSEPVDSQ